MTKDMYELISKQEIGEASKEDPMRAMLMVMANSNLSQAELQAKGLKRQPMYHDSG
jgi:hypothetical protein